MEVAQLDQDDTLNITSRGTTIGLLARTIHEIPKPRCGKPLGAKGVAPLFGNLGKQQCVVGPLSPSSARVASAKGFREFRHLYELSGLDDCYVSAYIEAVLVQIYVA